MRGLQAENLSKTRGGRPVLRSVSLRIEPGGGAALIGANGSGKTTLLTLLAGLARPESGSVALDGIDARKRPQTYRRRVGYAAHEPLLYPEWSGRRNLLFFARMRGVKRPKQRVEQELERSALTPYAETPARFYSRGMTQRLALARVFLREADLLLLDEPFAGLDGESRGALLKRLREERKRGAVLLIATHNAALGREAADRVVRLRDGSLAPAEPH